MNIRLYPKTGYLVSFAVLVMLLSGCGTQRRHEFVFVEGEADKPIGGWVVTPSLVRFEQGSSAEVEEYSLLINAVPTPDLRRYRLGLDSVEFILPGGGNPERGRLLAFENHQTESELFARRLTGVRFVTSVQEITCRIHMTLITIDTNERWNRSADYRITSHRHRNIWFGRRK
jgi:hypothetical protein